MRSDPPRLQTAVRVAAAMSPAPQGRRQRFLAPPRSRVQRQAFDHPIFDGFRAHAGWLTSPEWPSIATLDGALAGRLHASSGVVLRFAEQCDALLADGLHYEQRIHERGLIATRPCNWHDLFNALVWLELGALKSALNLRQVEDIARVGTRERTRGQCALTHFDEAGVIVVLRDRSLLRRWDAHDWPGLLFDAAEAWCDGGARVIVVGHALLEHALQPLPIHTAKCVAVVGEGAEIDSSTSVIGAVADAIVRGELLRDPQDLRPLPLTGLPGWHPRTLERGFYQDAPCFRPLRVDRRYPPPLEFHGS